MTSIGQLFPKCNKLAYDARQQLLQIQQGVGGGGAGTAPGTAATSDLFLVLEELERQLNIMEEDLVLREAPAQREKWKRKINALKAEVASLREQGQTADYHYQQQKRNSYNNHNNRQSEREELMLRRRRRTATDESDVQNLANEGESLEHSHRLVNSLIDQGAANLTDLKKQRGNMRGIRGMLTDISNNLGLTQSTMRIIERRDITDAYLVAAGIVVTCLVIYFVWF